MGKTWAHKIHPTCHWRLAGQWVLCGDRPRTKGRSVIPAPPHDRISVGTCVQCGSVGPFGTPTPKPQVPSPGAVSEPPPQGSFSHLSTTGGGGGSPPPPPPGPPPPPYFKRLRQIFVRAFGHSESFSGTFGANYCTPKIFFGASKNLAPPGVGGWGAGPPPPKRSPAPPFPGNCIRPWPIPLRLPVREVLAHAQDPMAAAFPADPARASTQLSFSTSDAPEAVTLNHVLTTLTEELEEEEPGDDEEGLQEEASQMESSEGGNLEELASSATIGGPPTEDEAVKLVERVCGFVCVRVCALGGAPALVPGRARDR